MKSSAIALLGVGLLCANAYAADTAVATQAATAAATTPTTQAVAAAPTAAPAQPATAAPTATATLAATTTSATVTTATTAAPTASTADQNKAQSDAFLAANKAKPGVVTLPDGLQYKVITEGKGAQPTETDTVTVDYAGTLVNGTEFDSSFKRGQPVTFRLNEVIPGWVEALKLMKAGSTWEIYIPPSLAYGEQGVPPAIGPNQALIFKVTLIDVKKS